MTFWPVVGGVFLGLVNEVVLLEVVEGLVVDEVFLEVVEIFPSMWIVLESPEKS